MSMRLIRGPGSTQVSGRDSSELDSLIAETPLVVAPYRFDDWNVRAITFETHCTGGTANNFQITSNVNPTVFVSETPDVCTVDTAGNVNLVTESQRLEPRTCSILVKGRGHTKRITRSVKIEGFSVYPVDVVSVDTSSLDEYFRNQVLSVLDGQIPGADSQALTVNPDGSGGINMNNMALTSGLLTLDQLTQIALGGRWHWLTPHHRVCVGHVAGGTNIVPEMIDNAFMGSYLPGKYAKAFLGTDFALVYTPNAWDGGSPKPLAHCMPNYYEYLSSYVDKHPYDRSTDGFNYPHEVPVWAARWNYDRTARWFQPVKWNGHPARFVHDQDMIPFCGCRAPDNCGWGGDSGWLCFAVVNGQYCPLTFIAWKGGGGPGLGQKERINAGLKIIAYDAGDPNYDSYAMAEVDLSNFTHYGT